MDRTLSGAITIGQSGPGSNSNEGVVHIHQISKNGASPSDGLMSNFGTHCGDISPPQGCSLYILQP